MAEARKAVAKPTHDDWADSGMEGQGPDSVIPLTAEQAAEWRSRHQQISPWKILTCQAVLAIVCMPLVWAVLQNSMAIISWLYGFLAIWLPAALFARIVVSQPSLGVLVICEMTKLLLSVVLIALAPWLLGDVVWSMLLLAIVLTVNMYWIAPIWLARSRSV